MVDDLEEESSQGLDLQHYLGVVRRRHLHFFSLCLRYGRWCGGRAG